MHKPVRCSTDAMAETHQVGVTGQVIGLRAKFAAGELQRWTVSPWAYGEVTCAAAFPTDREAGLEVGNLGFCAVSADRHWYYLDAGL